MTEPKTKATQTERPLPWLLHWTISDERIGKNRSNAYGIETGDGLVVIDPVPLTDEAMAELHDVCSILLTNGNHQRSAWRFRRELGVPVYAPRGVRPLEEEPDHYYDEGDRLPGGLTAVQSAAFSTACYLLHTGSDGTNAVFCGDLIFQNVDGTYRFPVQPGFFDRAGGEQDARRLLELGATAMFAAHGLPSLDGCRSALEGAINRPDQ